jgi:hypothetical protein
MNNKNNTYGYHMTSMKVSLQNKALAEQYKIKYSHAFRVGLGILLAERGVQEYDGNLNFMRKMGRISAVLSQKCQELDEINQKIAEKQVK